jgi:hypothetical protein
MPTIRGTFRLRPRPEDFAPCVWCVLPTDVRMITPFRPEIGSVPLHAGCAGAIIVAYEEFQATKRLSAADTIRMQRLLEHPAIDSHGEPQLLSPPN